MAKATKALLPVVEQPYSVVMTLSKEEAETLLAVLMRVGGVAETTRRKYSDSMLKAIREAGVSNSVLWDDISLSNRSIWFI